MNRATLIEHLKVQHGYVDEETDPDIETAASPGGFGIVNLSHPVWEHQHLIDLHEQDHADYPDVGTPVTGWAHRHKDGS